MIPAEKQKEFDSLIKDTVDNNLEHLIDMAYYLENDNAPMPNFNVHPTRIHALFRAPEYWDSFEERLILFLKANLWQKADFTGKGTQTYRHWFVGVVIFDLKTPITNAIEVLMGHGFSEEEIWLSCYNFWSDSFPLVAVYILNNADRYLSTLPYSFYNDFGLISRLIENKPDLIDKYLDKFIKRMVLCEPLKNYIGINPEKHENCLINCLSDTNYDYSKVFNFLHLIRNNYPNKYEKELELCAKRHFNLILDDSLEISTLVFNDFFNTLLMYNSYENTFKISLNYLNKFKRSDFSNFKIWLKKLKQYDTAMTPNIIENLWLFARHGDKDVRQQTAQHIAKTLGEAAIPKAEKMLLDKKSDVRLTGSLILSLIKTEKATAILRGCIADEMNDEVRNVMLESVSDFLIQNASEASVAEAVLAAQKRGKLAKPVLNWLVNYPQLSYKNSENALDSATISFLFYRMSQAKDVRTDVEARPLLSLINRETSAPFAKWLLDSYFQNGADAKYKWCLTLGAMLGGDAEIAFLQRNIVSFVDNNRGKMAENVVKALALQGSQRALRAVDFFSRKYKNKSLGKAALEAFDVAAEELNMTPYELADSVIPDFGFDGLFKEFEANKETYRAYIGNDFKLAFLDEDNKTLKALPKGTSAETKEEFKEIGKEIRDIVKSQSSRLEQYLVIQRRWSVDKWQGFFLTNPVMFVYAVRLIWGVFDEKNTLISVFRCQEDQSLTDAEGNEIDFLELKIKNLELKIDRVATDGRINSPTIDNATNINNGRIYSPENAQNTEGSFYELKIKNSELKTTNNDLQIGMVHPISLDGETIDFWKNELLDNGIEAIFPQLNRSVIALEPMDKSVKMSDAFDGVEVGGYTFLSRMEKAGWVKGSIGDGGCILSYYKTFAEVGLVAIVMQTGGLSVGYYDVNAEIGNLMFAQKSGVRFGSYQYDEPSKMNDPRLVRFGDVPPIVYSEVMADMAFFKENQAK